MPILDDEIPKHYRTTYKDNVEHLLNNEGSILRPFVSEQSIEGEQTSIVDQFGIVRGVKDTKRGDDTPIMNTPRDRRWIVPTTYHWGDLIDKKDKLKTVLDPTSPLVTGAAWGLGENLDYDEIIPSFFGPAKIGRKGESTETFDEVNQVVGVQVGSSPAADVGMNKKKIQTAVRKLMANKVKVGREQVYVAIGAEEWDSLMDETQLTSRDFVNGAVIATGQLGPIMGATLVAIEGLPIDANGHRRCPVWARSGVALGIDDDIGVMIAADPGKKFNVRVYANTTAGATRTQQGKVIEIKCKITP